MARKNLGFTPAQYRTFGALKALLLPYSDQMEVKVDQQESYYLAYPDQHQFKDKSGTMFAAIQIMDVTVALFIPVLMNKPVHLPEDVSRYLGNYIDSNGVIHIFHVTPEIQEAVKNLLHFMVQLRHTPTHKEVILGQAN